MPNIRNIYLQIRKHLYISMCIFFISIGVFYLTCAAALSVLPYYKQEIAKELSNTIGQPIHFSRVKFSWRGFRVYAKVYNVEVGKPIGNNEIDTPSGVQIDGIASIELHLQPMKSLINLRAKFDKILINGGKIFVTHQPETQDLDNIDINKVNIKKYLTKVLNQQYLGWVKIDHVAFKNMEVIVSTKRNNHVVINDFMVAEAKLSQTSNTDYIYGLVYKVNHDKTKNRVREKIELAIKYNKNIKDKSNKLVNHKFYFAANDSELISLVHDAITNKVKNLKSLSIDQNTEIKLWGEINNDDFENFDLSKKLEIHITSPSIKLELDQKNSINLSKVDGLMIYEGDLTSQDSFKLDLINFKTVFAKSLVVINSQIIKSDNDHPSYLKSDINFGHVDLKSFLAKLPTFIIGPETQNWLTTNIKTGKLGNSRLITRGFLDDSFPYDPKYDKPNGIFTLRTEILNTSLVFSEQWPKIENLDGVLTLRGRDISILSNKGLFVNNEIASLFVQIKGLGRPESDNLVLAAKIQSNGQGLADLIEKTPLKKDLNGVNTAAKFTGPIDIDLKLFIPIADNSKEVLTVDGKLAFNKNDLDILDTPLKFNQLDGVLSFTDHSAQAELSAFFNDKSALITVDHQASNLKIALNSQITADYLLEYYNFKDSSLISGDTNFNVLLNIDKNNYLSVYIDSQLKGMKVNIPKILFNNRLNKELSDEMNTRLTISGNLNTDTLRYNLQLNSNQSKNTDDIGGNFDYIKNKQYSSLAINTRDIVGNLNFIVDDKKNYSTVNAAFDKLSLHTDSEFIDKNSSSLDFFKLPKANINIKNFKFNDQLIGQLQLSTDSSFTEKVFKILDAKVEGETIDLNLNAIYKATGTSINGTYKVVDLPKLAAFISETDFKDQVKFDGKYDLQWPGNLFAFELKNLTGDLSVDSGYGRIKDVKLGIGRLFSFFNLQSLEKRLRFDFSDVFESGFKFDNVRGNFLVNNGVLNTDKILISAGSVDAELYGDIDVLNKSYNINADITPHITSSLPVAAAVVGTPVAGAVVFLVDKILESPVDQLSERSYSVTGPWSNPNIKKLKKKRGPLIEVSWLKDQQKNTAALWHGIFDNSEQN